MDIHCLVVYYINFAIGVYFLWICFVCRFRCSIRSSNLHMCLLHRDLDKTSTRQCFLTASKQSFPKQTLHKNPTFCFYTGFTICWLPFITLTVLIDLTKTSTPWKFYDVVNTLNYFNSFVNPVENAIRIPEFQQALCSCRTKRRAAIDTEQIERRNRTVALRTPVITIRILRVDPTRLR